MLVPSQQRRGILERSPWRPDADARRPSSRRPDRPRRSPAPARTCSSRVPMVCITRTPAARARASTASRSSASAGKVEMAVAVDQHQGGCSAKRGNTPAGLGSGVPGRSARPRPDSARRLRAPAATAELVEDPGRGVRHERLGQQREPADRLGEHVEHRRHARRVGPAQRPGRLGVDVAVGGADHLEDRLERPAQRLDRHRRAHLLEQGRRTPRAERDRRRSAAPGSGSRPSQLRWISDSTRCTRLP